MLHPSMGQRCAFTRPPVLARGPMPVPYSCATSPTKRPYGYWVQSGNLRRELRAFAAESADPARMPTERELVAGGRADIAGAVRRAGSWEVVSRDAGLVLTSIARPRSLYLTYCTALRSGRMKPYMFWRNFDNLRAELLSFMEERGLAPTAPLPTASVLDAAGRSDLVRAIGLHGGVETVSRRLNLRTRYHTKGHWREFENVKRGVRDVMLVFGTPGVMPPLALLRENAPPGLWAAVVNFHGGAAGVAKRMGLPLAHPRKPRGYWAVRENRAEEVRGFVDRLRDAGVYRYHGAMPTKAEMERHGRADLLRALERYGCFQEVAKDVGLVFTKTVAQNKE